MKKSLLTFLLTVFILSAFSFSVFAPENPTENLPLENSPELLAKAAEEKFENLYSSIDYGSGNKPAYPVFRKAFVGYLNLLHQGRLANKDILTLIDFSLPSVEKRLWIFDLKNKKVLFHDLVAHGKNSGDNLPTKFSNTLHSNMSSLGFYVTDQKYFGKHGLSLRLRGQEAGYNDKAMERAVVMHGADYVNPEICKSMGRLGRSFGCPAVSKRISNEVIETVADGSCLFIYYPDQGYLQNSHLLKEDKVLEFFLSAAYSK